MIPPTSASAAPYLPLNCTPISLTDGLRSEHLRQLLNPTDLTCDLGVAANRQDLAVRPRSHHANISKRLVKTPKVYFTDTGTLCSLAGLRDPRHAQAGPLGGPIFETAVLSEIVRTFISRGEEPRVYFWRTATGVEVDFLVEITGAIVPIEAKLTATPLPAMAKGIASLREDLGHRIQPGYLIHGGDQRLPLVPGVTALPLSAV